MGALGIAAALAAVAWAVLLTGHGGFWRTDQRLPGPAARDAGDAGPAGHARSDGAAGDAGPAGAAGEPFWPEVAAVVPARDEAAILPVTLPALLAQDYPGPFSVTLVDDGSSDGTGEVAAVLAARAPRALRVVPGVAPPPGWAGKPWAMAQGLAVASAGAPYILFTDADIAWQQPGALRALVAAAEASDRDLVSQMVLLRTETGWEKAIIPAFVYFFAQLLKDNAGRARKAPRQGGNSLARLHGYLYARLLRSGIDRRNILFGQLM